MRRTGLGRGNRLGVGVLLLAWIAVESSAIRAGEQKPEVSLQPWHWRDSRVCGQTAAYILLKLCGVTASLDSVRDVIPIVPEKGTNLAAIAAGCRHLGLDVEMARSSPSEFDKAPFPVIAHMLYPVSATRKNASGPEAVGLLHFVVVVGADDQVIRMVDPSSSGASPLIIMSRGAFFRRWTGELLYSTKKVVSRSNNIVDWTLGGVLTGATVMTFWHVFRRRMPGTCGGLLMAFVTSTCLLTSGCGSTVREAGVAEALATSEARPDEFDLVAMKVETDVGAIQPDESTTAVFPIKNFGAVPARLELGTPSCTCTKIALDKRTLAPGETASVRMTLANHSRVGPFQATVAISAVSQKWSEILTVRAFGMGFQTFSQSIRVPSDRVNKPIEIVGQLYTRQPTTRLAANVAIVQPHVPGKEGPLKIGPLQVSDPHASGACFERNVQITLPSLTTLLAGSNDLSQTLQLKLTVSFDGIEQGQTVFVKRAS